MLFFDSHEDGLGRVGGKELSDIFEHIIKVNFKVVGAMMNGEIVIKVTAADIKVTYASGELFGDGKNLILDKARYIFDVGSGVVCAWKRD